MAFYVDEVFNQIILPTQTLLYIIRNFVDYTIVSYNAFSCV